MRKRNLTQIHQGGGYNRINAVYKQEYGDRKKKEH